MTAFQKLSWLAQMGIHHFCDEKPHALTKNNNLFTPKTLQALNQKIMNIKNTLSVTATHVMVGVGTVPAEVLCVLESPSANEDRTGIPLTGEEGELLQKMLKAIQLDIQQQTYVTYLSPWRAPGARVLTPIEIQEGLTLLKERITIIHPKIIIAFGIPVVKAFTGTTLGQARMKPYLYEGIPVYATFAPNFLIKNSAYKKQAWADLKKIRGVLNQE